MYRRKTSKYLVYVLYTFFFYLRRTRLTVSPKCHNCQPRLEGRDYSLFLFIIIITFFFCTPRVRLSFNECISPPRDASCACVSLFFFYTKHMYTNHTITQTYSFFCNNNKLTHTILPSLSQAFFFCAIYFCIYNCISTIACDLLKLQRTDCTRVPIGKESAYQRLD